ncbi:MAG: protein-disulfide reductase DsbD family protein [Sphingobium sp.]
MMRIFSFLTMLVAAAMLMGVHGASASAQLAVPGGTSPGGTGGPYMAGHLEAENPDPAPGETVTLALVMQPEAGWHGYWENPGDAGVPTDLKWTLPTGATVGPLRYPVPHVLLVSGLMNHVYEGRYAVLTDLKLPATARPGEVLPIRVRANWLVCSDTVCVPEQADLALDLTVGSPGQGVGADRRQAAFDEYRRHLPRPLGGMALFEGDGKGGLRIGIPFPRDAALSDVHFFSLTTGAKNYAAPQRVGREGDRLVIALDRFAPPQDRLEGVLRIGADQGVAIQAEPGTVPIPADMGEGGSGTESGGAQGAWGWRVALIAFAGAVLGGLLLNIMPCVFPILSLKVMSLLRGGVSPAHARKEAWAYTAGVALTCVALGGAVLALRMSGEGVGWAFQLQSPAVIAALLALSIAIALNFAGWFELSPIPIDGSLTTRRGLAGDFWSGVLVAFVATPCTGPFMATALGTALLLPAGVAMAIFAGLGFGIALPFLVLAYVPALRARMPRPGPWMTRVQRWLSIPMILTAAALLWLLWRQAGEAGLAVGVVLGALVIAALWWLGRRQKDGRGGRGRGGLVAAGVCLLAVLAGGGTLAALPQGQPAMAGGQSAGDAFNEEALRQARASGAPLFLYFTADWCLSCKVNEAAAIDRAEVRDAFERQGVRTLIGDWTKGDPAITRFLEQHGRSGVPLYLWYPAGGGAAKELPQILTPAMLVDLAEG